MVDIYGNDSYNVLLVVTKCPVGHVKCQPDHTHTDSVWICFLFYLCSSESALNDVKCIQRVGGGGASLNSSFK